MGESQKRWKKKNRIALNAYRRKWIEEHPEKRKQYEKKYRDSHKKHICKKRKEWRVAHPGYDRDYARRVRKEVIKKYGGKCRELYT